MTEPLLRVEGLCKYFPYTKGVLFSKAVAQVKAVDGIDFSIAAGETLGLVGESGCGKTTTSKLILRLDHPTSGRILLQGKSIEDMKGDALREYRSLVQAVFQDPWSSLNSRMKVGRIIGESLIVARWGSSSDIRNRVAEVMVQVGLRPEHAQLYPHEFSGGQRQRIAVASGLASKPKLIVLDEPVSALDVSIRAQILNLLQDIQQRDNVAYLLIAHNLATVRHMAHQVAVMYLGQIVDYAPTEELFGNVLHPYTRALLSAVLPDHPGLRNEEIVLSGEVPSPLNPPSGCRFHTRCPFVMPKCSQEVPPLREAAPGHRVACHLYT